MSLTVIFADYLAGSISASEAVRKSGLSGLDDLVRAVKSAPSASARRESASPEPALRQMGVSETI